MDEERYSLTVGQALMNIIPVGTANYFEDIALGNETPPVGSDSDFTVLVEAGWWEPPVWPTDLFACAAHIIHTSGLLNYFEPDPDYRARPKGAQFAFTLTNAERGTCRKAGRQWSETTDVPDLVYKLWGKLVAAWEDRLRASSYAQNRRKKKAPDWWRAAVQLLIIADEASVGVGAPPNEDYPARWLVDVFQEIYATPFRKDNRLPRTGYRADRQRSTFGFDTDPDVGCVQPKSRVAAVGCNMRNLTRHLAYVTHAGHVRCHWQQPIYSSISEDFATLDILIVPIPLEIEANWIKQTRVVPEATKRPNWGNFEVEQGWLEDEELVIDLVCEEVRKAKAYLADNNVNGIIFPEYSLNEPLFKKICERIKTIEPQLEFAITGSSSNCEGETGNIVLTALWYTESATSKSHDASKYLLTSRRKHHRWRLNGEQIKDYALELSLPPQANWWETHTIAQRELHFFHFRKTSVFTTMICEDLARSDPCHDILRSIGPNLLFALLMDGPQLKSRWPARYASTLADDPGTSVLTITSLGLIGRSNATGRYPPKTTIAMWRDETGRTEELDLSPGSKSMVLSLKSELAKDQTLDGRVNAEARSWRYESHKSL